MLNQIRISKLITNFMLAVKHPALMIPSSHDLGQVYLFCSNKCKICEVFEQICSHSILKCSNCEEDHKINNSTCLFKTNSEKRSYKYAQNLQKSQQQEQQQQLNTNSFHVLIDNIQNY